MPVQEGCMFQWKIDCTCAFVAAHYSSIEGVALKEGLFPLHLKSYV